MVHCSLANVVLAMMRRERKRQSTYRNGLFSSHDADKISFDGQTAVKILPFHNYRLKPLSGETFEETL